MKQKGIRAITTGMTLLFLCMTGCGSQSEEATKQGNVIEQDPITELPTESLVDSPTESPVEGMTETDHGETKDKAVEKSYSEMTTAEKMKTLIVEGCSLPIPCKVEDMGDGLSLGDGITLIGGTICDLVYNGKEVGDVTMSEVSLVSDGFEDMSTGYENEWINIFSMNTFSGDFSIAGITAASTLEEIIYLWGEPDARDESDDKTATIIYYRDYDVSTEDESAYISFTFFEDYMAIVTMQNDER